MRFLALHLLFFLLLNMNLFLLMLQKKEIYQFNFFRHYYFWCWWFWLINLVWSICYIFCLDILFIKWYNKRFIQFRVLTFNILFKHFIEFWMNFRKMCFNSLSSLNHPLDPLDWISKLSKSFPRIVTTAYFISSNFPVPLSKSFVDNFFSENGVVTTDSFLSSKTLLTFSTNNIIYFPWLFPVNLLTPDHLKV